MAAAKRTTHTPDGVFRFDLSPAGMLGSGAHGVVRVAQNVATGAFVAIKVMPARLLAHLAKELIALAKMRHPNIVQLYGTQVDLDNRRVFMVMEMCRGGELFDRIAECGKLDDDAARGYMVQMTQAIAHCHAQNVFHRDLKPENILLDENDAIKIADFGLAALAQKTHEDASFLQHTKCGSLMYAAPEVLTSTAQAGYDAAKADIWSLGIIMYSMLSGALPFQVALADKCPRYAVVEQRGIRIACEANGFSEDATRLLEAILHPDPTQRISAAQVLTSAWAMQDGAARSAPGDSNAGAGLVKWADLLGSPSATPRCTGASVPNQDVDGKRRMDASDGEGGRASKALRATAAPATADAATAGGEAGSQGARRCAVTGEEEEETPEGINGMLVRSLGWVQLPQEKEKMVGDVASALDSLGVKYQVVKGELSDVVWVGSKSDGPDGLDPAEPTSDSVEAAAPRPANGRAVAFPTAPGRAPGAAGSPAEPPDSPAYSQGQLCVRLRIEPDADTKSALHLTRQAGDVLQFHSFYRDFRNQLAGTNGWRESEGRYEFEVPSK